MNKFNKFIFATIFVLCGTLMVFAAQQEFKQKTEGTSSVKEISVPVGTSRAYTVNGFPATSETRGIIIQNGKKTIRY